MNLLKLIQVTLLISIFSLPNLIAQHSNDLILHNKKNDKTILIKRKNRVKITLSNGEVLKGKYQLLANRQLNVKEQVISMDEIHLIQVPKTINKSLAIIGTSAFIFLDRNSRFRFSGIYPAHIALTGACTYYVLKKNIYNIQSSWEIQNK